MYTVYTLRKKKLSKLKTKAKGSWNKISSYPYYWRRRKPNTYKKNLVNPPFNNRFTWYNPSFVCGLLQVLGLVHLQLCQRIHTRYLNICRISGQLPDIRYNPTAFLITFFLHNYDWKGKKIIHIKRQSLNNLAKTTKYEGSLVGLERDLSSMAGMFCV